MKIPSLENLRDYAFFLLEILSLGKNSGSEEQIKIHTDLIEDYTAIINHLFEKKNKSQMKEMISELEIPLKLYDPNIMLIIKDNVYKRFNIKLDSHKDEKKLTEILKRGAIKTEKEYRLVRSFIEIFETDKTKEKFVSELMLLMDEFDLALLKRKSLHNPKKKK